MEIKLFDFRTVILENELIRVMILVDKGADIIEFNFKAHDTDFVWTNPMGISCLRKMRGIFVDNDIISDNYLGGWFDIMPNLGGKCEVDGTTFPAHSEVSYLPWEYSIIKDDKDEVCLEFFVKLSKYPFLMKRRMTIKSNKATITFDEEITNLGIEPLPYQWGFHPNIGGLFLDENCVIDLPSCDTENFDCNGNKKKSKWPMLKTDSDEALDISKFPARGSMINRLVNLTNLNKGFGTIKNMTTDLGITFSFDKTTFTSCALWISANNDIGHHHQKGAYVVCILAKNTNVFCLDKAIIGNEAPILDGFARVKTTFSMTVFKDNRKIIDVDKFGNINYETELQK